MTREEFAKSAMAALVFEDGYDDYRHAVNADKVAEQAVRYADALVEANMKFLAFLTNNADAFLELWEAAEKSCKDFIAPNTNCLSVSEMNAALKKLEDPK